MGNIANKQVGEILDRYFALECNASAAGSVRARASGRSRRVSATVAYYETVWLLRVGYAYLDIHRKSSDRIYYRTWFNGDPDAVTQRSAQPAWDRTDRLKPDCLRMERNE